MNTQYTIYVEYSQRREMTVVAMRTYDLQDQVVDESIQTFNDLSHRQVQRTILGQLRVTYPEPDVNVTVYVGSNSFSRQDSANNITVIPLINDHKLRQLNYMTWEAVSEMHNNRKGDTPSWVYDI